VKVIAIATRVIGRSADPAVSKISRSADGQIADSADDTAAPAA